MRELFASQDNLVISLMGDLAMKRTIRAEFLCIIERHCGVILTNKFAAPLSFILLKDKGIKEAFIWLKEAELLIEIEQPNYDLLLLKCAPICSANHKCCQFQRPFFHFF